MLYAILYNVGLMILRSAVPATICLKNLESSFLLYFNSHTVSSVLPSPFCNKYWDPMEHKHFLGNTFLLKLDTLSSRVSMYVLLFSISARNVRRLLTEPASISFACCHFKNENGLKRKKPGLPDRIHVFKPGGWIKFFLFAFP